MTIHRPHPSIINACSSEARERRQRWFWPGPRSPEPLITSSVPRASQPPQKHIRTHWYIAGFFSERGFCHRKGGIAKQRHGSARSRDNPANRIVHAPTATLHTARQPQSPPGLAWQHVSTRKPRTRSTNKPPRHATPMRPQQPSPINPCNDMSPTTTQTRPQSSPPKVQRLAVCPAQHAPPKMQHMTVHR
jgi:hypothetical protein